MAQSKPKSDMDELMELLNTPITGASKREQKQTDSPQAIEVVKGDDIRAMGIYRLGDILRYMTSMDVMEADSGFTVVGSRGVMQEGQPRTVQVLIDGVPFYPALGASLDINNLPLPVDLIERIEIVRGPSSTLYGANAVVGVIAITTRTIEKGNHGELRATRSDKNTYRGAANVRFSDGHFGFMAGYSGASIGNSGYRTHQVGVTTPENRWITFDGATAVGHQSDKSNQRALFARTEWKNDNTTLWFNVGQSSKWLSPVGMQPVTYMNYRFYKTDTLLAGWRQTWGETFSTEVRIHRMHVLTGGGASPILVPVLGDPGWNNEYTWGDFTSDQIDLQANWNPSTTLHFVFGADTRKMLAGKDPTHGFNEEKKESASGGFVAMDWNTTPTTTLSLGMRAENESLGGSRISPRAAFVWNPAKNSTIRLAYLTSTRSPQFFEQNVNFAARAPIPGFPPANYPVMATILPNEKLQPEQTKNYEVGFRQQIGTTTWDLTVYSMKFKDLITQETTKVTSLAPLPITRVDTQFQNTGSATNQGVELTMTWLVSKPWTIGANMAYDKFRKDNPKPQDPLGDKFAYDPGTKVNIWSRYILDRFNFYVAIQHVGGTDVQALQVYGSTLYDKRDAYLQFQVKAGYEILPGLSLSAHVRNGAREFTPQGTSGPDRPTYYYAMRREFGLTAGYRW